MLQQQAALMVAATAQAGYISPMTALASHALNGMANSVVPPASGLYHAHSCIFIYIIITNLYILLTDNGFSINHFFILNVILVRFLLN